MINTDNLCMSCMKDIGTEKQCPYCGFHSDTAQLAPYLPIRTIIGNRYMVGKLLDYNGEGATYIGWDLTRKTAINIRELFPDALVTRTPGETEVRVLPGNEHSYANVMQSFLELWRRLVRLRGLSALICAVDIIEENGTAYTFYEYEEYISLREFLLRSETGYIPWERVRQLFMPVLSTLGTLHSSGIIHRGISPSTLLIGHDGKIRISGFCIGQARTAQGELSAQLFPGYAAIEQYGFEGQQGPWTDIYAFGAVMYRALIGTDPIDASIRATNDRLMVPGKFAEQLPAYVINGLVNSLQIMPADRTKNVEQLRAELSAAPTVTVASDYNSTGAAPVNPAPPVQRTPPKPKASTTGIALRTAVAIIAVGLLVVTILSLTVFKDKIFNNDTNVTTNIEETTLGQDLVIVPNFLANRYVSVVNQASYTSKFTFVMEEAYDDEITEGYIISQSVPANSSVERGTTIILTVSLGKEKITLPKISGIGMTYDKAKDLLTNIGFVCEKKENANDGSHIAGEIISVLPAEEVEYDKGTKVYITVWGEPPTTATTAPAVTEAPVADSTNEILNATSF